MKTVTEFLRQKRDDRLGISNLQEVKDQNKILSEINGMVESLNNITNLCKPRLIMGGIRYGSNWSHDPLMKYMQSKFDAYKKTGNLEMLVDFVNFCAIEWKLKTHPNCHFSPKDRK